MTRSIPAPAGEPLWLSPGIWTSSVYPRACGGTAVLDVDGDVRAGLSPRLRGNRCEPCKTVRVVGSIPAPAGEPSGHFCPSVSLKVYPRACGGTPAPVSRALPRSGLSPRLRGNHRYAVQHHVQLRSIPAPAGEPSQGVPGAGGPPVYPRACGGTARRPPRPIRMTGLSPRLRGNQMMPSTPPANAGSIPAPAGEPESGLLSIRFAEVYPRACGGTFRRSCHFVSVSGLSPRLRGNLKNSPHFDKKYRSIPAPAGEPESRLPQWR